MEAPVVALPGEIDPFGMAKFIAHKVQIALTAAGQCKQADHLMEGNGPVDNRIMARLVHIRVHIGIRQSEDHGLIAYQRLIVALHIGDGFLSGSAQAHIAPHFADLPILVPLFLDGFDPHIRQTHAQPVIEANAAILNG